MCGRSCPAVSRPVGSPAPIWSEVIVLDTDATIVITHCEKENAAPTFKRTFGFHPLGVWCDNTSEFLAGKLRAGNAGSNTAADHIEVLADAIAQIPAGHRKKLLIRSDGAGASHKLLDWLIRAGPGPRPERGVLGGVRDHRDSCAKPSTWSPRRPGQRRSMPTAASVRAVTSPS